MPGWQVLEHCTSNDMILAFIAAGLRVIRALSKVKGN
jgi:hypothetical protein